MPEERGGFRNGAAGKEEGGESRGGGIAGILSLCFEVSETERKREKERERREFNSRRRFTQEKRGRKIKEDFFKTILNLLIKT